MASFWEQFISIFKGTTKKKKKDTPRRRSYVSEKAKKETHKPAKRSAPTPSRKGRQANPEVVKRGQTLGTQAVKQHKQYEAYRAKKKAQQNKQDMQILQRTTGQKYKHNQEIKPAVYTGNPEDYAKYRVNAKVIDKTKDKTVYDKKTGTSKGVTLKEYYSAPEHQKEAQKQMAQDEKFINEHPFLAGFGSSYSKFANRSVEDLKDIYSNVKRKDGGKGINTKKYDKSTAAKVGEMAGTASQYLITGGAAGGVKAGATAGAKMLGKLTAKKGAKTIAKAVTKKALKEGAKKATKKLSKEGIKKFAKNRAAEVAADMPLDIAHSYKDSKGDTKELVKNMGLNLAMNVGVGGGAEYLGKGVKALKNKAVAKSAVKKAAKNRKETAKAVKGALESLENRAKAQGDYLSDLRTKMGVKTKTAPKQKPVKGKTVKKAKAETELTIENIRTGKKITGRPRNKQEAQMMLRVASRGAKSTDDIRTTTREVGSPRSRVRNTSKEIPDREIIGEPLRKEDIDKLPTRPIKDSEIEEGARGLEKEWDDSPVNTTADYNKGLKSAKTSKVREKKVKELLPSNHKLNGNTKEILKDIDDDISEIVARRSAGDMQGADGLERDLARKLAEEDKYIYDKGLDTSSDYRVIKDYVSNKPFYPPEGMTVKEAQEMFGARNPEAKGVIKFVKRNGKRKGREIDVLAGEFDDLFPGVLKNKGNTEDILGDIREYLEGGYNKDLSLMGELQGKELDDLVNMKRDSIRSAVEDIEKGIAKSETPKVKENATNIAPKKASAEGPAKAGGGGSSAEPPRNEPPENRTPAEAKKVAEEGEPVAKINSRLEQSKTKADKTFFRKAKVGLQKAFVDAGAAFENIARNAIKNGDKKLGGEVYDAVNSLRQTSKSVEYQILDAQTDLNYHRIGESIHDIIDPLRKNDVFDDAQALLFHEHNIDRMKQNKPVFGESIDGSASRKEIDRIRNKYDAGTLKLIDDQNAKIKQYFKNLKQMRVDAGLMSKDVSDYLDELYPNYVQTKRMGDVTKGVSSNNNIIGATKGKNATGSSRDLLSIDDQMIRATNEVWRGAKNNNLITKVVELQGGTGKALKDGTDLDTVLADSLFAEEVKKGEYRLRYFENGEAKTIDCDEEVYKSLKSLNGQGWNPPEYAKKIADITAGSANSIFKKLCTEWNPFFALYRNPMRDLQDALMYSKDFGAYITHMPVAIKRMVKKDEYWQLWKASGGTASSLFDITSKIKKSKNPLRRVGLMNQAVEQYPRFTEFCAQLDKQLNGKPVSSATREMIDKASQAGADITVNFGRTGDVTKLLNRYAVPFLNPGVQGVSKAVRLVTERSGAKAFIGLATKAAALGFTPAVINEALMHDDKGYQQMNARDKLTNYIFKLGDNYVKIPKGRLLSLIGMGGMKTANTAYGGDDYTFDEMMDVAKNQSAPANPFSDNLAMTAYNAINNKTWYGGNIQSDYDEDNKVDQTKVYDANTTSLAKELAKTDFFKSIENANKVKGVSPKKIDAMLKGYSGVLGELAMPLMTQRAKGAGLQGTLANLAKKTFTIDPRYQNELSTKFYEKVSDSARTADETGKAKDKTQSKYYSDQSKRVSAINDVIKDVQDSDRSYEEKNKMVDALTDRRNKLMDNALKGVKMADDYKMRDMDAVRDVMGAKYALNQYMSDSDKKVAEKYGDYDKFYSSYRAVKSIGSTSKGAKAVALAATGSDKKLYGAYDLDDDYRKTAKEYIKNGGSVEEFAKATKITAGSGNSYMAKALKLAKANAPDRLYAAYNIYENKMNSARILASTGMKPAEYEKMKKQADADGNGYFKKEELAGFFSNVKLPKAQKSALFSSWARKGTVNPYGEPAHKSGNYKLKGVGETTKPTKASSNGKSGQIDYSTPEAKAFFNKFGANMSKERLELAQKLYKAAKASKKGINAPYSNDKDYLPKETLQVVRSGDKELDAEALKALKNGGLKNIIRKANATLPKVKEPEDNTTFDDDGSSSGGGRGYYRRYGRRYGRGGGSSGGTTDTGIDEVKATPNKTKTYNWTPEDFKSKPGWTDAQIRKVFNALIKQGLTEQQAVSRIASLWNTRFS